MKKNQVNEILVEQTKNRSKIISISLVIFVVFILALSFFLIFIDRNQTQYVKYKEKSDLDYTVYLKDNDYYVQKYLPADQQYIASLIDYIKAEFNYDLEVEKEDIDYQYSYKIESELKVIEKSTKKNIYQQKENLVDEILEQSYNKSKVNIHKFVNIDYNKYNNLITQFVNLYGLNNVETVLNVNMYVSVVGDCEDIEDANTESVISLSIPLTTNTVSIDMKYDLVDENQEKLMVCEKPSVGAYIFILISSFFIIIDICLVIKLIDIIKKGRTAESIYERKLKKILNNYKSYIQKLENSISLDNYTLYVVSTFTDMLEIRDTVNQPILMVEDRTKKGVHFIIPTHSTKILYVYTLKVSEIKKELEEKKNEDF